MTTTAMDQQEDQRFNRACHSMANFINDLRQQGCSVSEIANLLLGTASSLFAEEHGDFGTACILASMARRIGEQAKSKALMN